MQSSITGFGNISDRPSIELVKIISEDQLGDLFTKGLSSINLSWLQKKLIGW
jgi:hypothetical protein